MHSIKILVSGIAVLLVLWAPYSFSDETFSCPYGDRAACLNYGDKIVDQSSICFSQGTCGYGGFVCKNKYDNIVQKYNNLIDDYNSVVDKNQKLVELDKELSDENQRLTDKYNALLAKYKRATR